MSTNKKEERIFVVQLSEYYPNNCSEQDTELVTKRTELYMRRCKVRAESKARKDRRHMSGYYFDEIVTAAKEGIYTPSPEEDICGYSEKEALQYAISKLSEYEQTIIELYYYEDMKLLDVAAEVGKPKSTVSTNLRKAREKIKETMLEVKKNS